MSDWKGMKDKIGTQVDGLVNLDWDKLIQKHELEESAKPKTAAARNFLMHVVLLCLLVCVLTLPQDTYTSYDMFSSAEAALLGNELAPGIKWESITESSDVFVFLSALLLPLIHSQAWYNGELYPPNEAVSYQPYFLNGVSLTLGTISLRQLRVMPGTCVLSDALGEMVPKCYGPYSGTNEEKTEFSWEGGSTQYVTGSLLDDGGAWFSAATKVRYGGGGFVEELPVSSLEDALARVEELSQGSWVDERTRAVFIDFSLYNPNEDQFLHGRLVLERAASGAVVTSSNLEAAALLRVIRAINDDNSSKRYFWAFTFQAVLYALVTLHVVHMADELVDSWGDFLVFVRMPWNLADMLMVVCFIGNLACTAIWMLRAATISYVVDIDYDDAEEDWDKYFSVASTLYMFRKSRTFIAMALLLCFIRSFKYIGITPSLQSLARTVSKSAKELAVLLFILGVVFCGYGVAFQMSFGSALPEFRDFPSSLLTLFLILLGQFDLITLRLVNPAMGTLLFISFMILVNFVVLSMLLKVVDVAFGQVMEEMEVEEAGDVRRDLGLALQSIIHDTYWFLKAKFTILEATVYEMMGPKEHEKLVPEKGQDEEKKGRDEEMAGAAITSGRKENGHPSPQHQKEAVKLTKSKSFRVMTAGEVEDLAESQVEDHVVIDRFRMLQHRQAMISKLAKRLEGAISAEADKKK
ncbi:unnamed protein product [Chrysoparadoxa australica]